MIVYISWPCLQTIFSRLYKPGSSFQQGTLLQLRNLINRRNVSKDTSGKFNETLDFFHLVVECHIMAAAMHFFSMSTLESTPSTNALPSMVGKTPLEKWSTLKASLTRLVCRYVLVDSIASDLTPPDDSQHNDPTLSCVVNPHSVRIAEEHNHAMTHKARIAAEHCYASATHDKQQQKRCLPQWLCESYDQVTTCYQLQKASPDGISRVLRQGSRLKLSK